VILVREARRFAETGFAVSKSEALRFPKIGFAKAGSDLMVSYTIDFSMRGYFRGRPRPRGAARELSQLCGGRRLGRALTVRFGYRRRFSGGKGHVRYVLVLTDKRVFVDFFGCDW
jgi:hypothetical protein